MSPQRRADPGFAVGRRAKAVQFLTAADTITAHRLELHNTGTGGGLWRASVAFEVMRGFCAEVGEDYDTVYLSPGDAMLAAAWARGAGLVPDQQRLLEVFAVPDTEETSPGPSLFDQALSAMGLPDRTASEPG